MDNIHPLGSLRNPSPSRWLCRAPESDDGRSAVAQIRFIHMAGNAPGVVTTMAVAMWGWPRDSTARPLRRPLGNSPPTWRSSEPGFGQASACYSPPSSSCAATIAASDPGAGKEGGATVCSAVSPAAFSS